MELSLLFLGLAVAALGPFLAHSGSRPNRRATPLALALGYSLPALFLLVCLLGFRDPATRFRFALVGLGFRAESEGQGFERSIGGDPEEDDVWVSRFSAGTRLGKLAFVPDPSGDPEASGSVRVEIGDGRGGLLRLGPRDLIREVELLPGDVITADGRRFTYGRSEHLLGPDRDRFTSDDGGVIELPTRFGTLPLLGVRVPIWRPVGVDLRTHPLSGVTGSPLKSFLYYRPEGLSGRLFLVCLDPEVRLSRDGVERQLRVAAVVEESTGIHAMRLPRPTDDPLVASSGVADRRSFQIVPGSRSVVLELHTPEIYTLRREELRELQVEAPGGEAEDVLQVSIAMGDWPVGDKYLHFRHASRPVASEALGTLVLPRQRPSGLLPWRRPFEVAAPRGIGRIRPGTPFWLGSNHLAAVQVDLLTPPVTLAVLTLILVAFKVFAARSGRLSNAMLCFAAALEALVAFRLLLAYRVWAMPPFDGEAMELALVAWALLPWGFLVATLPPLRAEGLSRRTLERWLPALGGWAFSLAWCHRFGGGGLSALVWPALHLAALAVPIVRGDLLRPRAAGGWPAAATWLRVWCLAPVAVLLFRGLLLFAGFRESLVIGGVRFSLSLIHIPLTLALEAGYLVWLWQRLEDRGGLGRRDWWPAPLFVVAAWLVPAMTVSDLGLALLNIPIFLLALGSLALAARRLLDAPWRSKTGLACALPLLLIGLYLFSVGTPFTTRVFVRLLPEGARFELGSERNYLRLLQYAYPDELRQVARRSSEELSIMSAVMRSYTAGPFLGRGYCRSKISPHLRSTALREHVPAIFVAGEWGWTGAAGLVLVFFSMITAGRSFLPWHAPGRFASPGGLTLGEVAAATAHLAGLTFGLASLYMILANYGLALFTGRNAYLLGLDSRADVLESFLLALLFAAGAAVVRDEEVSP